MVVISRSKAADEWAPRTVRLWLPAAEERWPIQRCIVVIGAACAAFWTAVFYLISLLL